MWFKSNFGTAQKHLFNAFKFAWISQEKLLDFIFIAVTDFWNLNKLIEQFIVDIDSNLNGIWS